LCRASGVSADIDPGGVPIISYEIHELVKLGCVPQGSRDNLNAATVLVDWAQTDETCQTLLTDAQTSGGLLLCIAEANLREALKVLRKAGTHSAALIGRIVPRRRRRPLICMTE
jgi:selenide,water dikinase